ncbi:uncharacterized protein LOC129741633 isoform X1 [Uranotaenia lowii]|uniref:uncharacterized protein LOC129741633 isoform X1 n=1 Tax=Uranotaenia lowii TaxID=190385 RepID=UPI0024793844|nr:uncharacterized protein LOC129741633 isoform X1 [Uranotaenia lowii]XP_055589350.1 uncharacterized protein LOC129741633 isoform X1 [Uranotaenia lowii]
MRRGESYDHCQSFDDKKFVIDKNGRICERKKKGRLYSLGGNDPPRKCNRGRLDRLKTVGTFDITNEISRLSQKTVNLNERIIGNQLFARTIDETTTSAIGSAAGSIGAGLVPFIATTAFGPVINPANGMADKPHPIGSIRSINGPTLTKQNTEIIHLSPHHHLTLNHPLILHPMQHQQLKAAKSRSLSTGSYITKESSVHSSVEIIKSNSNADLNDNTQKTIDTIPKNKSLEDSRTLRLNASRSPLRKPILRKSKKIVRTDSEFLKGNIYEKESSLSSSQYTPTHERRREFADHRSSNPSSETHKSTDESSKNISTDEIDTVFSDTMELEQMEADYKMHLRNNLQREYKSDSDTLDEIGKKQPDYNTWKNQSYENTFDIFEEKEQEGDDSESSPKDATAKTEESTDEVDGEKSADISETPKTSESNIKTKRTLERPKDLELGTSSDGSKNPSTEGPFGHIFEKNLGRFKKMNKLLKCKRFSTSALYDKKSKPNFKDPITFEDKSSPVPKPVTETAQSPAKSNHSQSKASICSSKSSLFGNKKSNVPAQKGKKFSFFSNASNEKGKTSPSKSKSNSEISYFRTKSTKGSKKSLKNNSTACLNLETTCTSPLSEAFYNTTGSVRLSAIELYEKFCSQDFSGLYKHEAIRSDIGDDESGTDSGQYDPNRSLGAIRKNRRKNFKLLRQKSEPKFSFRSDTLYENEDSYEESGYPDEHPKVVYEPEDYNQFLYDEQYYEEDIENLSIENIYYRGNLVNEDGTIVEAYQYQIDGYEDEYVEEEEDEEDDGDEDENGTPCNRMLEIVDSELEPPLIDMATSADSDCDEIYLMPQNESKKLIIHDFLFHHRNDEFDHVDADYTASEESLNALDRVKDQDTLTIYKICSKESILSSKGELDNIPLSSSLDQCFFQSNCCTALERTASLELLSNSSGTLNKSTLTDYAFDTVKNVNLDSCSTSRLSLSLKSEIFEETLANAAHDGSGEIKQIKNWNIEDFTLTPEGSFSDETMDELWKSHLGDEIECNNAPSEAKTEEGTVVELPDQPATSEYTIIDLDEEPYLLDPAISEFTNEITKEFDLLFSRAETESRAVSYSGSPAYETKNEDNQPDPLANRTPVPIELPTRYSMQRLEPINLDADEIKITRHAEDQLKTQHDSAKEVAVDKQCSRVDNCNPLEEENRKKTTTSSTTVLATSSSGRLRKARSQSLGNLKNKTKCFPL